jgi:hypothetical protein
MDALIQKFENDFKEGFEQDLQATLEGLQGEKVYTCAFGTDNCWGTLYLAINTEESLNRHIENMKAENLYDGVQDYYHYRWCCSEFQYGEGHLNNTSELLDSAAAKFTLEDFTFSEDVHEFREKIVKSIVKVVNETDKSLFSRFGQSKEDITFFISIMDDEGAEELENRSVVLMTSCELSNEFLNGNKIKWL